MAVIVLAVGAPDSAVDAVRSLLVQDLPIEILVVNSGGGGMAARLAAHGIEVPVIERQERVFVGAARNIGIKATRAPYVAFLASDCRATAEWARRRMLAHQRGLAAVASTLVNSNPRNPFAWALHLTVFPRRQPKLKRRSLAFGASYDRRLFDEHGYFREDLRIAEDSEFNNRLPDDKKPVWEPDVTTVHLNPTNPVALLRDQFARGKRAAQSRFDYSSTTLQFGWSAWWHRTSMAIRMSRYAPRRYRRYVRLALPIIPIATAAHCLGAQFWMLSRGRGAGRSVAMAKAPVPPEGASETRVLAAQAAPRRKAASGQLRKTGSDV